MTLSRRLKVWLACILMWPLVGLLLLVVIALAVDWDKMPTSGLFPNALAFMFMAAFGLTILSQIGLWIYFVVLAAEARYGLSAAERTPWLLVILLGGTLGSLAFFWLKVWPDPPSPPSALSQYMRDQEAMSRLGLGGPLQGADSEGGQTDAVRP